MTTTTTAQATGLRFYQLAFAVLPDGTVGVIRDEDLPGDRQTVRVDDGLLLRVAEDFPGWNKGGEEAVMAEEAPPLSAFLSALDRHIGGASRERRESGPLAFFSLFLARLPDGDVRAIDVCDIPEEAWASGNAHCACDNARDPFGRYEGRYASEIPPTPEEVADAVRRATRKVDA